MDEELKLSYPLILFDSECPLCVRYKQSLLRLDLDKKFSFTSIHDSETTKYIEVDESKNANDFKNKLHVFTSSSEFLEGADALSFIVELLPGASKFSWLIESNMGKKAINFFYEMSDQYRRSLLNRCSSCKK